MLLKGVVEQARQATDGIGSSFASRAHECAEQTRGDDDVCVDDGDEIGVGVGCDGRGQRARFAEGARRWVRRDGQQLQPRIE